MDAQTPKHRWRNPVLRKRTKAADFHNGGICGHLAKFCRYCGRCRQCAAKGGCPARRPAPE